jgi:hypothetical protein
MCVQKPFKRFSFFKGRSNLLPKGGTRLSRGKKRWSNQQQDTVKIRFFFYFKGGQVQTDKTTRSCSSSVQTDARPLRQRHTPVCGASIDIYYDPLCLCL